MDGATGGFGAAAAAVARTPLPAVLSNAPRFDVVLSESRHRWREMVGLITDLAFETDLDGRLTLVSPDPALGWPVGTLLGQPAALLLADASGDPTCVPGFNPFRLGPPVRRRRAWLKRSDGVNVCLAFATTPIVGPDGRTVGMRGVAQDVTDQDSRDAAVAASLRRGEIVDAILERMRQEVLAPRMMQAALAALVTATGAEGGTVLDLTVPILDIAAADEPGDGPLPLRHLVGPPVPSVLQAARVLTDQIAVDRQEPGTEARDGRAHDGRAVLVCPGNTRGGGRMALVLWRAPDARAWDAEEKLIAVAATSIIRVSLEHDAIQREMGRQARTDSLTSLLNRRAFLDDLAGRIDRLDREQLPGTLMFVDLDHFKSLNDRFGHEAGDEALCITAALLRATVRPSDLVARFGGDEFAIWLDGADELTAAERAEALRLEAPERLGHLSRGEDPPVTMSIGIACRWPGEDIDIDAMIRRADLAMYDVKRNGRAHWRVARRPAS